MKLLSEDFLDTGPALDSRIWEFITLRWGLPEGWAAEFTTHFLEGDELHNLTVDLQHKDAP